MVLYRERLWPSKWMPLIWFLLIPLIWLIVAPFNVILGFVLGFIAFGIALAITYARIPEVIVTAETFTYGRAQIETAFIGSVSAFSGAPAIEQRRTKLDARAWVKFRAIGDGLVRIEIVDANDPTPYWLVSTRNPNGLASALRNARK